MAIEIEKKYLLNSHEIINLLEQDGVDFIVKQITQAYLKISKNHEIRLRTIDKRYFLTQKYGLGLVREEIEQELDKITFRFMKKNIIGKTINKTRYIFKLENLHANIDIYKKNFKNLAILEIEFEDENSALEFKLPEFFIKFIDKEVTHDESYKNKNLALYGIDNFSLHDLENIFTQISHEPFNDKIISKIPKNISAYDGARVLLFALLKKVNFYKNSGLDDLENLHNFRVNIRKIRTLFASSKGVFDKDIAEKFLSKLRYISLETNAKSDDYAFKKYLKTLDDIEAEQVLAILNYQQSENKDICLPNEYEKIVQELSILSKDDVRLFQDKNADEPFVRVCATSLGKKIKKIKTALSLLHERSALAEFHTLRLEFKKIRYQAYFLQFILGQKNVKKIIKISKQMQNIFGKLQDLDSGREILQNIENDKRFSVDILAINATQIVQEILIDEIYSLQYKILRNKTKLLGDLNICLKDLKIYIG